MEPNITKKKNLLKKAREEWNKFGLPILCQKCQAGYISEYLGTDKIFCLNCKTEFKLKEVTTK